MIMITMVCIGMNHGWVDW